MTNFSKDVLNEKLAQCAQALADLKRYQAVGTLEYFRAHPDIYYAACFRFVGVIEALFDAGQVVIASRGQRAMSEGDISTILAREGVITADLSEKFSRMYGFRNRLVHAYGTLDDARVTEYLADHLGDIEELLAVLSAVAVTD